ncbi:MAG: Lrp/AsnC family transcriptional regulator [Proteobacteria bacterium]|nr:Lrp/AsnC family transcriptional regulator [Pseudomonadota bacterium]
MIELDSTDIRILKVLQSEGRIAIVDLAERVNLSATACHKRIDKLERAGVIVGYGANVSLRAIGYQVEAFVAVTIDRQAKVTADSFMVEIKKLENLRACYLLSGDTDFLLHVIAPDLDAYTRGVLNQIMTLPGAQAVRTSFVLDKMVSTAPLTPLAPA